MGQIKAAGDQFLRAFTTDGVPSSGANEPDKGEGKVMVAFIDAATSALALAQVAAGAIAKDNLASLNADLAHPANRLGFVVNDTTPAYNGVYLKVGGSGSGSWNLTGLSLPISFVNDLSAAESAISTLQGDLAGLADNSIATTGGLLTFTGNLGSGASLALLAATAGDAVFGTPGRVIDAPVMKLLLESIDQRFFGVNDTQFSGSGLAFVNGSIIDGTITIDVPKATFGDLVYGVPNRVLTPDVMLPALNGKLNVSAKATGTHAISGSRDDLWISPYALKQALNAKILSVAAAENPDLEAIGELIDNRMSSDFSNAVYDDTDWSAVLDKDTGVPAYIEPIDGLIPGTLDPYESSQRIVLNGARARPTSAYDLFDTSFIRDANYNGGSAGGSESHGFLNANLRVTTLVGQDALSNEQNLMVVLVNRAPGAGGSAGVQNWAQAVYVEKAVRTEPEGGWANPEDARTSHTGGIVIQFNDRTIEESPEDATGSSPMEVSYRGNSEFGQGKGIINMTAAPIVGTHTEMAQILGFSMIGDVYVERLMSVYRSSAIETFDGENTGAVGDYGFLFAEPEYSLSRQGEMMVRNSVVNRSNGQTPLEHAFVAQVDGVDKAKFYGENSGSAILAGDGVKLIVNAVTGRIEYQVGAGPVRRVKDDTPVSGAAALTAQGLLDLFGWGLAAADVSHVFDLDASVGTFNGWMLQGSPTGQAVVLITKGLDANVPGSVLCKGSASLALGNETYGEVLTLAGSASEETVIASDVYVPGSIRRKPKKYTAYSGGQTYVQPSEEYVLLYNSPGTIASHEVIIPACEDGSIFHITAFGSIGAITWTSAGGATFVNAPSSLNYSSCTLQYEASLNVLYIL